MLRSCHKSCRPVAPQAAKLFFRHQAQHACKPNMGPKRKLRLLLRALINPGLLTQILNSIGALQYSRTTIVNAKITFGAALISDTKTLPSISLLAGYSWQARSLRFVNPVMLLDYPRIKKLQRLTSMRTVMDSGGYLYMTIPTINWHEPP